MIRRETDFKLFCNPCRTEFIRLVSSEANEVCEKSAKKTIAPEHVVTALKELGFETFIGDIEEVLKEHNTQVKVGDLEVLLLSKGD